MTVSVVIPPEPILLPAEVPGSHAADDARVAAMVAAATEELDGPQGWLGRCIGPQTLELVGCSFYELANGYGIRLPCPPVIEIVSVKYLDSAGGEQTVDPSLYRPAYGHLAVQPSRSWPSTGWFPDAIRVRYRAGYNDTAVASGGTGPIPDRVKQAIIMSVQQMIALGAENLFLRSEKVEGVGETQYTVSDQTANLVRAAAKQLLSGLKVPRV